VYVIIVYDVEEKRVAKMPRIIRRYLKHVQRSVFEGEITPAKLERLKMEIREIIDEKADTVRIYVLRSDRAFKTEVLGVDTLPDFIV